MSEKENSVKGEKIDPSLPLTERSFCYFVKHPEGGKNWYFRTSVSKTRPRKVVGVLLGHDPKDNQWYLLNYIRDAADNIIKATTTKLKQRYREIGEVRFCWVAEITDEEYATARLDKLTNAQHETYKDRKRIERSDIRRAIFAKEPLPEGPGGGTLGVQERRDDMAYVTPNFPTKAALMKAVKAGEEVAVFQPGMGEVPLNGEIGVEGPHYPKPHSWYARVTLKDGKVVKVK